jgi:hypothetical protein
MERFAKIGVGAGRTFDAATLTSEVKQAIEQGIADAWKEYNEFKSTQVDSGKVTSGDMFGTREYLKNNYLYRMSAAILGIYGNSKGRGDVSHLHRGRFGRETRLREKPLHATLRAGSVASCQCILVTDDV